MYLVLIARKNSLKMNKNIFNPYSGLHFQIYSVHHKTHIVLRKKQKNKSLRCISYNGTVGLFIQGKEGGCETGIGKLANGITPGLGSWMTMPSITLQLYKLLLFTSSSLLYQQVEWGVRGTACVWRFLGYGVYFKKERSFRCIILGLRIAEENQSY